MTHEINPEYKGIAYFEILDLGTDAEVKSWRIRKLIQKLKLAVRLVVLIKIRFCNGVDTASICFVKIYSKNLFVLNYNLSLYYC